MGCSTQKTVYWCGDHPCINKKEREAYFKKTMIVEIKDLKDKKFKKSGEIEKIINEAKTKEKVRIKNEKEHAKIKKIEEKSLAKQLFRKKVIHVVFLEKANFFEKSRRV